MVDYVLAPDHIEIIAKNVVAQYDKEFSSANISKLEQLLKRIDREMDGITIDMLESTEEPGVEGYAEKFEFDANWVTKIFCRKLSYFIWQLFHCFYGKSLVLL